MDSLTKTLLDMVLARGLYGRRTGDTLYRSTADVIAAIRRDGYNNTAPRFDLRSARKEATKHAVSA